MKPVVGDWNGDGIDTAAVFDAGGVWHIRNSNTAGTADFGAFAYGAGSWVPLAGAWDMRDIPLVEPNGPNPSGIVSGTATDQDLSNMVSAALQRLADAGADPALLAKLAKADVEFVNFSYGILAVANPAANQLLLDANAAGYGWFVDSTPTQDQEFTNGAAPLGSPAANRIDLLSAVTLGLAQLIGLDLASPGLHNAVLGPGVRKTDAVQNAILSLGGGPPASSVAPTANQQTAPLTTGQPTMTADPNLPGLGLPGVSLPSTTGNSTPTGLGSTTLGSGTTTGLGSTTITAGPSVGGILLNDPHANGQ
jgi:hypothetical protein